MKTIFVGLALAVISSAAISAQATPYTCTQTDAAVCALNQESGECTAGWTDETSENPNVDCMKFVVQDFESNYVASGSCRKVGGGACLLSPSGNCTIQFEARDYSNPMDACQRHARPRASGKYCRKIGGGACIVNASTGNCTIEFSNRDYSNPMDTCLRQIGARGPKRQGYFCRKAGMGYCSVNPATNKCTRYWSDNRESSVALRECQNYVRN